MCAVLGKDNVDLIAVGSWRTAVERLGQMIVFRETTGINTFETSDDFA